MAIQKAELKFYKSQTVSNASSNGGRMSATQIISGAINNIFPQIGETDRAAGVTLYRKIFLKVANADLKALSNPFVVMNQDTPGDDTNTFFPGTQTDTQASITGSEQQYGCASLDQNANASDTSVDVALKAGAANPFADGQEIRITNNVAIDDTSGSEEFLTIGSTSRAGDVVTINFSPALQNSYVTSNTRVMSVYRPPSSVVASVDNLVVTSGDTGDFNSDFLAADDIGSIEQSWTATFTSPTEFDIVGDTVGSQGSGTVGAGASPNNASFSEPYFVLQAGGFSGTFQAGDTITFDTHPAAIPAWMKKVVPAGAAIIASDPGDIAFKGETA